MAVTVEEQKTRKDAEKIEEFREKYDVYFQQILDQNYLQPFPKIPPGRYSDREFPTKVKYPKTNLQDGLIERETHGAMHATRVSEHIQNINELNKQYRRTEIIAIFAVLEKAFGCNEVQLIPLTQFGGLHHDTLREDEYEDRWEKPSGEHYREFLEKVLRLNQTLARVFECALVYKDKPDLFRAELKKFIDDEIVIKACDYLRQLVHDGDCLDIMRCESSFYIHMLEIFKHAKDKKEFKEAIIELAQNTHTLLYNQGDLLFDCKVYIRDEKSLTKIPTQHEGSHFSLKIKTRFEHASNVRQAILQSFREIPYFAKGLNTSQMNGAIDFVEAGFNPFLHGTNSSILAFLRRTNFEFLSPLDMITRFHLAPMSGEISQGGLEKLTSDGAMCFGRLNSHGRNDYTFAKIIEKYTSFHFKEPDLKELSEKLQSCFTCNFTKINEFLVHLCRAKQWGLDIHQLPLGEIERQIHLTKQYYYLLLCLTDHLMPNLNAIRKHAALNSQLRETIEKRVTEKYLKEMIVASGLNMQVVWNEPTEGTLEALMNIFDLPKTVAIDDSSDPKVVSFPETIRLFCLSDKKPNKYKQCYRDYNSLGKFNGFVGCGAEPIFFLLSEMFEFDNPDHDRLELDFRGLEVADLQSLVVEPKDFKGELQDMAKIPYPGLVTLKPSRLGVFQEFRPFLLAHLELLETRLSTMMSIFQSQIFAPFSEQEKSWIRNPFPIVLMSEDEDNIEMFDFSRREFRLKRNCRMFLGQQILFITENEYNAEQLELYQQHQNIPAPVYLYSDIKLGIHPVTIQDRKSQEVLKPYIGQRNVSVVMDYLYQQRKISGEGSQKAKLNLLEDGREDNAEAVAVVRRSLASCTV